MKYSLGVISILMFISLSSCAQMKNIHWNATHGYYGTIETLLDEGADVNSRDKEGKTPLILASWSPRNYRAVQVLLERGADVNAQANDGLSALMVASLFNSVKIADELISHGADVHARTEKGMSALMYATAKDHEEIVKLLLNAGAGKDTRNVHSALTVARNAGFENIYYLLRKAWLEEAALSYINEAKAIAEGNSTSEYKHVVGILLLHFYNNENAKEFSPESIDYAMIDSNNVLSLLNEELTGDGILLVPPVLLEFVLSPHVSEELAEESGESVIRSLSVIDEYIQTGNFNKTKAVNLTFPLLVEIGPDEFQWDERFPLYLVIGLETQMHDKPAHVLGSALGIVRFSRKGKYTAMGIVPYDFSNINDSILADKILSFMLPTEKEFR